MTRQREVDYSNYGIISIIWNVGVHQHNGRGESCEEYNGTSSRRK